MSRQGSNTRCYTVGDMQNNTDQESSLGQAKSKPEVIKLGLDLHGRQVTECRQLDGSILRLRLAEQFIEMRGEALEATKASPFVPAVVIVRPGIRVVRDR